MVFRYKLLGIIGTGLLAFLAAGCGLFEAFTVPAPDSLTGEACFSTPSDMEGPYYIPDAPFKDSLYPEGTPGQRLIISGTVYTAGCVDVYADAIVDVWQADANGEYDFSDQFIGRGRVTTDTNGHYQFETILPARYEPRPPHIHLKISHPDAAAITTQLYFAGNDNGGVSDALTIPLQQDGDTLHGTFDIVLEPR